jgi:hypothetical protein
MFMPKRQLFTQRRNDRNEIQILGMMQAITNLENDVARRVSDYTGRSENLEA